MSKFITNNRPLNLKLKPLTLAVLTALAAAPALTHATTPVAPGQPLDASEFLVNASITTQGQINPKVARDAAGDFVVVWEGQESIGTQNFNEIFARRYSAAGQPQGGTFLVNTFTTGNLEALSVAMDAAGDFVVAWTSNDQAATSSSNDIYARQFKADGSAVQASEFLVNTYTSNFQENPAVAMDAAGDFVVAWTSNDQAATTSGNDIYARQFQADGSAMQLSEFLVNTVTGTSQRNPAVAMDAAGDFVVTWRSNNQAATNSKYDVYARSYRANGTAVQASEFLVNTFTSDNQEAPTVAMDAAGDFVIGWTSYDRPTVVTCGTNTCTNTYADIFAQRYTAAGITAGANFQVNTATSGNFEEPSVAMDAAGDFVIGWVSDDRPTMVTYGANTYTDQFGDIFARRYNAAGTALGTSEFQINIATSGNLKAPSVAMDAAGDFVAAYKYYAPITAGTYEYGIYARRYQGPEQVDLKAGLAASPATIAFGGSVSLTASLDNDTTPSTLVPVSVPGGDLINAAIGTPALPQAAITLPSGVSFTSASGTNWSCPGAPASSVLTCSYTASLAAGNTATPLTVKVTAPASAGTATFSAAVSSLQEDSQSSDNTASADVSVVSGIPTASNGSVSTSENTAGSGTLSGSDADGDTLTFAIVSNASHGTVTITNAATGAFSYTPDSDYSGSDSFTFKATDSAGNVSNTATESVTITASSGGGSGGGGSGGSGSSGGSSGGGGGGLGLLSLALLGLPLLRKRRS